MSTVLKIGPEDHDRPMTLEELQSGDYEEGFHYEIIDGRLYVSPKANFPQFDLERWLFLTLTSYSLKHPEVINYTAFGARVFVPDRPGITVPEPDFSAYRDFPRHLPSEEVRWEEVSPILVAEVLSADDPDKDLVRNVHLYFQVPSIKEYWILDNRVHPGQPTLQVRRRRGKRWVILDFAYGETYTTRLLPGFELIIDPRS